MVNEEEILSIMTRDFHKDMAFEVNSFLSNSQKNVYRIRQCNQLKQNSVTLKSAEFSNLIQCMVCSRIMPKINSVSIFDRSKLRLQPPEPMNEDQPKFLGRALFFLKNINFSCEQISTQLQLEQITKTSSDQHTSFPSYK